MKVVAVTIFFTLGITSAYPQEGDTITYKSKSKLEWSDFRMKVEASENEARAHLNVTIVTETKNVSIAWGTLTVDSYAGVRRDSSWVLNQYADDNLLRYMQLKYDLANMIAKKSGNEINTKKINAGNKKKIWKIIDAHLLELKSTLKQMDLETGNGQQLDIVEKWQAKVTK